MYTPQLLEDIWIENSHLASECRRLSSDLQQVSFSLREQSKEHALYGITRRLMLLRSCLLFFISELPPDTKEEVSSDSRAAGNAHLHAFLMNCVGICDNIAWLIAFQKNIDKELDFTQKKERKKIGLFNSSFERHLPPNVLRVKKKHNGWFTYISSQRDPVAHRIPPYIIPYRIDPITGTHDYTPMYTHSPAESGLTPLHSQCIADAGAVVELVEALLEDIPAIT